jgi:hypothetical protein
MGTKGDLEYPDNQDYLPCKQILAQLTALGKAKGLEIHALDFSGLLASAANVGGCHHPSEKAHAAMANIAVPIARAALGW